MPKPIYTAEATVTGGRVHGHGRSSDGELDVQLRPPGAGGGTNPEQLFAVGYAACFENALATVARRARTELGEVSIDSRVSLVPAAERTFELAVELHLTLDDGGDPDAARALVAAAHRVCPYSNATRGNVDVTITVNGEPLG